MNHGQILLQFPSGSDVNRAISECEQRGYRLIQQIPFSAIGFNWVLQRGKTLAALTFDKSMGSWLLVEAIR